MPENYRFQLQDLADAPFAHVRIGNLKQIEEPGINAVLSDRAFSPAAMAYSQKLDVDQITRTHLHSTDPNATRFSFAGALLPREKFRSHIHKEWASHFPREKGRLALFNDLATAYEEISDACRGRKGPNGVVYSGDLYIRLQANLQGSWGVMHRDRMFDVHGLIVVAGEGTYCASNAVHRTVNLPDSNPLRGQTDDVRNDIYGTVSQDFAAHIRRAPAGRALFFLGSLNGDRAHIHCEPAVETKQQARLVATAIPYENTGYYKLK